MIEIAVPGFGALKAAHLVLDHNGTRDVVAGGIVDALGMLVEPRRLVATLRD